MGGKPQRSSVCVCAGVVVWGISRLCVERKQRYGECECECGGTQAKRMSRARARVRRRRRRGEERRGKRNRQMGSALWQKKQDGTICLLTQLLLGTKAAFKW